MGRMGNSGGIVQHQTVLTPIGGSLWYKAVLLDVQDPVVREIGNLKVTATYIYFKGKSDIKRWPIQNITKFRRHDSVFSFEYVSKRVDDGRGNLNIMEAPRKEYFKTDHAMEVFNTSVTFSKIMEDAHYWKKELEKAMLY